jgi:O-acetyl-ADP-ribose deacetylase (regulator of RNase III)
VDALVNTVNTVGVMGKGIALMFKDRFPKNMAEYAKACKAEQVATGQMFVTQTDELMGPKWIVNFPTKQHWRSKSKMEWVVDGLDDLKRFILDSDVRSIALPPLGAGNGGLKWADVKPQIEGALAELSSVDIYIYEPTAKYQNVAKPNGVEALTPPRALISEMVRRYWVLGMDCSLLEIHKLAWFLQRAIQKQGQELDLNLKFSANYYGPYSNNLEHLLNALDGSYLQADKRITDSSKEDVIRFNDVKKEKLTTYLNSDAKHFSPSLDKALAVIEGFESPYGLELLSTVDWVISQQECQPDLASVRAAIDGWPAGPKWGARKQKIFDDRSIQYAIDRIESTLM